MNNKVYIIDHELISPIAVGREEILPAINKNFSADGPLIRKDIRGLNFNTGAEVREALTHFYQDESAPVKELCKLDRKLELLAAAFGKAKSNLAPLIDQMNPERTGVILGVGAEELPLKENEEQLIQSVEKKLSAIYELMAHLNPLYGKFNRIVNPFDMYALYLADKFNARAFQKSVLTACVSSTQAIAQAYDSILRNQAEVVIAGGTDSILNLVALISFGKLGVIAESDGNISCRPFDNNRYGAIAGEAAGFVIMASEEFVRKNKLKPIAAILGYGNTLDGYKITAPDPSAAAMSKAIQKAVQQSGIAVNQYDYYYAHGTGTRQNDGVELKALQNALGESAHKIAVSSTKDRHGHAIAAAGIQELSILLEMMKGGTIPGNLNLQNPIDQKINLLRENQQKQINYALKSNFAFGGVNTVLAVKNEKEWS
ncbi:MAG: beta-ketoacyl-[acyl-carrier-protein] synthase family protein [Crocinitomicaceae bacterium]